MNKQCWRCRMYLPASELQQYRGQLTCPYCIMDLRDADRHSEEREAPRKPKMEALAIPETCDRCGRDLESRVYIYNGRKLCKSCLGDEQDKWGLVGGGPMSSPYKVTLGPEIKRKKASLLESLIGDALALLGIRKKKRKEIEIVVVGQMPIQNAKPMAENEMGGKKKAKEERRPQAESIMGTDQKEKPAPAPESIIPESRFDRDGSQKSGPSIRKRVPHKRKSEGKKKP
jgi:hypothetical protein